MSPIPSSTTSRCSSSSDVRSEISQDPACAWRAMFDSASGKVASVSSAGDIAGYHCDQPVEADAGLEASAALAAGNDNATAKTRWIAVS